VFSYFRVFVIHLYVEGEIVKEELFEPKILAFICNWCAYGAADLAGVSRLQYPPNVRAIRVMCSATVSPHHILRALQDGADGVLVGG
jgi:F420-non-reducing hydrogenase iron-sulfur subunit